MECLRRAADSGVALKTVVDTNYRLGVVGTLLHIASLVPRLSLNIRKGGGEERESLANFIVTFRSGCPLFFRTVNKVLTHIHRHRLARLSICSANALRMRGFTPCSHGHVVVVTTTEPESAERLPYAKFARLSSLRIIESLGTRLAYCFQV